MFELTFCAILTLLPDYLFRRFVQGKRIGQEITLFSVWYELRIGLTAWLALTILLFTVIFYFHPSTSTVSSFYRTVTLLPERSGRVAEVFAVNGDTVEAGAPIFALDDATQRAAVETAERRVEEVEAGFVVAQTDLAAAQGALTQAEGARKQAEDELAVQQELLDRNSGAASPREVERLQTLVATRQGAVDAAEAQVAAVEAQLDTLIPAQRASAEAALEEAETALEKSVVYAGTTGELQQFALQPGDFVTAIGRPAGILVPPDVGAGRFTAGFNQVSAQQIHVGMIGEMTCAALPLTIIPMRVIAIQDFLPSGQFRPTDRLMDVQDFQRPGSLMVLMEPLYEGTADRVPRGAACLANLYTDNHERLASGEVSGLRSLALHAVDTVGVIHAFGIRARAILMPIQTLVLTGGH
ncbi:MAG: HlyD family secretion protein [Pseudomonadota bacterium]